MTPAFDATPVQQRLMELVTDGRYRVIGFGGGIRGTKTWGALSVIVALCKLFPMSRWAIVRKDLERIRKNTLPSFNKLRALTGGFVGPVNGQTWEAACANGSVIIFHGENIDKDPELERWHGLEVNGFVLEEASELAERGYVKSIERAGAWIVPAGYEQPPELILCTFNPTAAWPKRVFYDPWKNGTIAPPYAFLPSTIADNPHAPASYREALKAMPAHEYKRFVEGDWAVLSGRYYDALDGRVHLIEREQLPDPLPDFWEYWGGFDWGYGHWAVFGFFARDPEGVTYLLDSVWVRKRQDDEIANTVIATCPMPACLEAVYAGHDCWARVKARGGSGISTFDVFADMGIYLIQADIDRVNGGRAVRRALRVKDGRAGFYIVRTEHNQRVFEQLAETMPDEDNVEEPLKVDSDSEGRGGDDGADMVRYGLATMIETPVDRTEEYEALKERAKLDPLSRQEAERFDDLVKKAERRMRGVRR